MEDDFPSAGAKRDYNTFMAPPQGLILVVEDVPDTLELVEVTLKFKGYRVATARDGREALEAIKSELPALVVTDILMPHLDGFNLVHRLRLDAATRGIPVIFLSATYVTPEDKEFALAIGVSRFIEKPIDMDELLGAVAEFMAHGAPPPPEPLQEREFYEGYLKRLEMKLGQKVKQITRIEGMLESLSEDEKPSFKTSLQQAAAERDEIQQLIAQIREKLQEG